MKQNYKIIRKNWWRKFIFISFAFWVTRGVAKILANIYDFGYNNRCKRLSLQNSPPLIFSGVLAIPLVTVYMFFYKPNAYYHTKPEIKCIFKHKLNMIVILGRLLIDFFDRNCYLLIKYDLIRNASEIVYTTNPYILLWLLRVSYNKRKRA